VGGDREKIDIHRADVDRLTAGGLGRVDMEEDAVAARNSTNLGNGVNGADLIVRMHERDQGCIGPDGFFDIMQIDLAVFVYRPRSGRLRKISPVSKSKC
jgi:hypothetical protein